MMVVARHVKMGKICQAEVNLVNAGFHVPDFAANPTQPRRYHAHTACFSRKHTMAQIYEFLGNKLRLYHEDFRLWKINVKDDVSVRLDRRALPVTGCSDVSPAGQCGSVILELRKKNT